MRWCNGFATGLLLFAAAHATAQNRQVTEQPLTIETVDPLTVPDEDFARNRDPENWAGLSVSRLTWGEQQLTWRAWRIVNLQRTDGPLWVLPHDNENSTFAAALIALRSWGGVMMAIDSDPAAQGYATRFNASTSGSRIDPNRNFRDELPRYAGTMLADLGAPPRLIIALHTNEPGFDASLSQCPRPSYGGRGNISVRLCNARFHPSASRDQIWPFDDDDTLALLPYLRESDMQAGFCAKRLNAADFNIVFEHVTTTDGSLSNYAALHGLRYINLETGETGSSPDALNSARNRLIDMIDRVMNLCGDSPAISLAVPPAPVQK